MNKFPKCPSWGGGVTYNIPIHGKCTLHVPMGLCSTQKALADLSADISKFVTDQFTELATPDEQVQQAGAMMKHIEKQYQQLEVEAKRLTDAYTKAQAVVKHEKGEE